MTKYDGLFTIYLQKFGCFFYALVVEYLAL